MTEAENGEEMSVMLSMEHVHELKGDPLYLLVIVTSKNRYAVEFALPNAMSDDLRWTLPRFKAAKQALEDADLIECIDRGGKGRGNSPIYRFSPKLNFIP